MVCDCARSRGRGAEVMWDAGVGYSGEARNYWLDAARMIGVAQRLDRRRERWCPGVPASAVPCRRGTCGVVSRVKRGGGERKERGEIGWRSFAQTLSLFLFLKNFRTEP